MIKKNAGADNRAARSLFKECAEKIQALEKRIYDLEIIVNSNRREAQEKFMREKLIRDAQDSSGVFPILDTN